MQDAAITLGHYSLFFAFVASTWSILAAVLGVVVGHGRGLQRSAEHAVWWTAGLLLTSTVCLVSGFLTDDFRIDYVFHYSSTSQALPYKIGALWGGQAGSLLLWVLMLAVMSALVVAGNMRKNRSLMPWVIVVLGFVTVFFLFLLNFIYPPFEIGPMRPDGVGLNPQLKNYWMMIHPPTLYVGYVGFTIPFAFAMAALITGRTGDIWFRSTRRWTIFSWFFLGTGILLGSYWAYIELGWGGYWAWDPVENASLMPWLTGTAFLHSVMIQEKKGMLKVWNVMLIIMTFCLSIFGTYLTRSGIISSVHAFATSDINGPFLTFLGVVFLFSMVLLIFRLESLRSEAKLESLVSRESSFLFNNMIFVGLAGTVFFLTMFPIVSEAVTQRKVTMGPPIFNMVNVPWALVLLFLTGVGPLIAWRRASAANLRRSFLVPGLIGIWLLALLCIVEARKIGAGLSEFASAIGSLDVAGGFEAIGVMYPVLAMALGAFVLGTVAVEYYRGTRMRMRKHDEALPVAVGRLVWRNKRRYGGYLVHVGIVVIFFGIAGSSAYQIEERRQLAPGQALVVDDYLMRYDGYELEAVDDHIGALAHVSLFDRTSGRPLGNVVAEQRLHPTLAYADLREAFLAAKSIEHGTPEHERAVAGLYPLIRRLEGLRGREVKTPSTEVGIRSFRWPNDPSRWGEDFYVMPLAVDPNTGTANFRIFVNPMVNFIWIGGALFVFGSLVCLAPDRRERQRLEAAMALEDRAVA